MVTIRPVVKWMQALAALLLLAVGPVVEPSRAEEKALSRVSLGDGGKAIALKREQTVTTRAEAQPEGSDDDGGPDAALADAAASAQLWVLAVGLPRIDSPARPSRRFCGASPRAPPSA
jgi:hypothetical protein